MAMNVRILLLLLASWTLSARADAPPTIVFLGDSITAGYGLPNPSAQAYPALIENKITAAGLAYQVVNAGLSGDTTAGGLRRLSWLLRQPIDILVIALGGNDGLRGIAPEVTRGNLEQMIDQVRTTHPHIRLVLAGMQMPVNMGAAYTQQFRDLFPQVAREKNCALIPFLLEEVGARAEFNQADLIHPNIEGQIKVAENVWMTLERLL